MNSARWVYASLVGVALLASAPPALANGRYPRAERLLENPGDPNELWLAATYGLLVTHDRGKSWRHVCEAGFALDSQYLGDPLLSFASNGILQVGVQTSINMSSDEGCQWAPVLGGPKQYVPDYAVAPSSLSTLVAVVADQREGGLVNVLYESTDGGKTWAPAGSPLPVSSVYTVDVAPDDPGRIYATGLQGGSGQFLLSPDNGATWSVSPIPGTGSDQAPYIAGVHPLDRKQIFVRVDAWTQGANASEVANDALLYTSDEGQTWKEVFRNQAKLYGFALSPDGATVLIGFGDPKGFQQFVTGPVGVYKSPTGSFAFEQILQGYVNCLAWTRTGVYVCGSQQDDQFEIAFSPNADFAGDGGCLTPLLRLNEVQGPLECSANASSTACVADWDTACATLGACDSDAGASTPAPSCIPVATGDGGAGLADGGSATSDAGRGASDSGTGGTADGGPSTPGTTGNAGGGCGLSTVRSRSAFGGVSTILLFVGGLRWRRRRSSRRLLRQ